MSDTTEKNWQKLIEEYRDFDGVSDELKSASLAQWIVESGRGSSELAQKHNNYGGIKYRDRMAGRALPVEYTGSDGETTIYCKFDGPKDFISGYWHFISSGPYEGWEEHEDSAAEYLRHIAGNYAGDPKYLSKVVGVLPEAEELLAGGQTTETNDAEEDVQNIDDSATESAELVRIAIIVGHNADKKGAHAPSPISAYEFDWNGAVAERMKNEAGHYGLEIKIVLRKNVGSYTKEINKAYADVADFDPACALELHFNSFEKLSANGIEMLCRPQRPRAHALALSLAEGTEDLLGLKLRHNGKGVKLVLPGDRGAASCYALKNIPTVLCEPFFASNKNDRLRAAEAGKGALARCYLRAIRDWVV